MWRYFDCQEYSDGTVISTCKLQLLAPVGVDGTTQGAVCQRTSKPFKYKNTSTLKEHLNQFHAREYQIADAKAKAERDARTKTSAEMRTCKRRAHSFSPLPPTEATLPYTRSEPQCQVITHQLALFIVSILYITY